MRTERASKRSSCDPPSRGLPRRPPARRCAAPPRRIRQRARGEGALKEAHAPFEVPQGAELDQRLPSVLEVIYLVFNEGYAATAGESWMRLDLCEEALRLGRVLASLAPKQPEAHGLVALMEIQASRARARTAPDGQPVLLLDQDRSRWDRGNGLGADRGAL